MQSVRPLWQVYSGHMWDSNPCCAESHQGSFDVLSQALLTLKHKPACWSSLAMNTCSDLTLCSKPPAGFVFCKEHKVVQLL